MPASVNMRSPTIKRILQEMKEIKQAMADEPDACPFAAEALEDDVYQWCFCIRGPADSPFSKGIYHGRILLPPEYPFKPPSFIMLTPSGRFETNTKICLSISSYHPEQWQPSWSMRTALTALIAFFPSPAKGAVGSQEAPDSERALMALESRRKVPHVASAERMEVMKRLHAFLERQSSKPENQGTQEEQADACVHAEGSEPSQEQQPVQPAVAKQSTNVPAEESVPAQQRTAAYTPTIQACMRWLDRLVVLAFTLLGILIAWNVLQTP